MGAKRKKSAFTVWPWLPLKTLFPFFLLNIFRENLSEHFRMQESFAPFLFNRDHSFILSQGEVFRWYVCVEVLNKVFSNI